MKISMGLVLALSLMSTVTNAQFNNEVPERQSRADRPMKLCGQQLGQVLSLVCGSRGKRHAVAEPSYRMSPFMMSIYRPSIDDEDKWAADWADLKLESSPGMDFYNRINSLRVRILKILLSRVRESARRATRAFKRLQGPARNFRNQQEYVQDIKNLRITK